MAGAMGWGGEVRVPHCSALLAREYLKEDWVMT